MITEKDIIEYLNINDSKSLTILRGHVNIVDKFGNTILDKDNLVVLQGRKYALDKLFAGGNEYSNVNGASNLSNENRVIMGFAVGNGGTSTESVGGTVSPSPFLPSYSDTSLVRQLGEVAFVDSISKEGSDTNNETYMMIKINLHEHLAENATINELGLFAVDKQNPNLNPLLVTRITFGDITLSAGDELVLNYYLYA